MNSWSKIPQHMDDLMWLIADQPDPAAIESFERRYPELRSELLKRINMVHEMKGAKGMEVPVPAFQPTIAAGSLRRRVWPVVLASSALACLALASFWVTDRLLHGGDLPGVNTAKRPAVGKFEPEKESTTVKLPAEAEVIPAPPTVEKPANVEFSKPENSRITVKLKDVPLSMAISVIASESGLHIELAPGFPDTSVTIDFSGQPAIQVLEAMGVEYGFTPLSQEAGSVLLVPAKDPNRTAPSAPGVTETGSH